MNAVVIVSSVFLAWSALHIIAAEREARVQAHVKQAPPNAHIKQPSDQPIVVRQASN
jgi:hypothetical protein